MLRLRLELVPFGNESEAQTIGSMVIANDGTGDYRWGNYVYAFKENSSEEVISGYISDHYRGQGAWNLVKRILNSPHENDEGKQDYVDLVVEKLDADL